jgi:cytochrome c peroxidase
VTKDPKDRGRFKTPTLRNVALTWPYLHDGSARTLADVVEFYDRGGVPNPTLDVFISPLDLSDDDKKDLVAFLEALTGTLPKVDRPALPK